MTESTMREALLRQGNATAIEPELKMLNDLIEAENHRVQRFTRWTIAIWISWLITMALTCLVLLAMDHPIVLQIQTVKRVALLDIIAILVADAVFPVVGIILLILTIQARRSPTTTKIQDSLAAIDSRLKLLASTQKTPPADSQT